LSTAIIPFELSDIARVLSLFACGFRQPLQQHIPALKCLFYFKPLRDRKIVRHRHCRTAGTFPA
jgi:hypothetical protein